MSRPKGFSMSLEHKEAISKALKNLHTSKTYKGNRKDYVYILTSPFPHNTFETTNLQEFCLKNSLGYSGVYQMLTGHCKSYKGWTGFIQGKEYLKEEKPKWRITDPQGKLWEATNLKDFCEGNFVNKYLSIRQSLYYNEGNWKGWKFERIVTKI